MKLTLIKTNTMNKQMYVYYQILTTQKSRFRNPVKLLSEIVLLFFFNVLINSSISAQEVRSLNSVIGVKNVETLKLRSLLFDQQPTLYLEENNVVSEKVDSPLLLETDAASIKRLYEIKPEYNNVEVVRINIEKQEDLNLLLDIARLSNFNNLKYLYFLCTFDICTDQTTKSACETEKILKMVTPSKNSNITILYLISIPT
jgi:hypothetical protein